MNVHSSNSTQTEYGLSIKRMLRFELSQILEDFYGYQFYIGDSIRIMPYPTPNNYPNDHIRIIDVGTNSVKLIQGIQYEYKPD